MIGLVVKTSSVDFVRAVGSQSKPVRDAKFRNFGHAGASVRKAAIDSMKKGREGRRRQTRTVNGRTRVVIRHRASPPGTPPYYHVNKGFVRQGIRFDASEDSVFVGATASKYGQAMSAHEHGGMYKGQHYPPRPFMQPAMEKNLERFHESWRGSIGS